MKKMDAELRHEVEAELATDPSVEPADIGVTVKTGVVTLTGQVSCWHARCQAEAKAKRIAGVRGLANEIEVLRADAGPTDTALAETVLIALQGNAAVPAERIKVIVSRGHVTLEGKVAVSHQRTAAEAAVRQLDGLKGLTNLIAIEPPSAIDTDIVKRRIAEALHRRAQLDAERIAVAVRDDTVVLEGNVASIVDGDEAEAAVWGVPGVRDVENNLAVKR
jgi:osmotically-inducible protein OsmY